MLQFLKLYLFLLVIIYICLCQSVHNYRISIMGFEFRFGVYATEKEFGFGSCFPIVSSCREFYSGRTHPNFFRTLRNARRFLAAATRCFPPAWRLSAPASAFPAIAAAVASSHISINNACSTPCIFLSVCYQVHHIANEAAERLVLHELFVYLRVVIQKVLHHFS
jgi:hypothetical protein